MINVILEPKSSKNIIATIAIGSQYQYNWITHAEPNWKEYCIKHDLGLIVVTDDLIPKNDSHWKKANWQKMLLGQAIKNLNKGIKNVCHIDTDFIINPLAPNVFDNIDLSRISIVSQEKNLPFDDKLVKRKISFYSSA